MSWRGFICAAVMVCGTAMAQDAAAPSTSPAGTMTYDVVTIKPNTSGSGSVRVSGDGERYLASNVSLRQMLEDAYSVRRDLIFGVPKDVDAARFDVNAKILEPDAKAWGKMNRAQKGALLRPVLAGRFGLKAHLETRMLPLYELVAAKDGPKFKAVLVGANTGHLGVNNTHLTGQGISMTALARELGDRIHATVIDKTGLDGNYDIDLSWTPDGMDQGDGPPGIFTAVQEQLGLKLRATKGPVQVLVVDAAAMPTEN